MGYNQNDKKLARQYYGPSLKSNRSTQWTTRPSNLRPPQEGNPGTMITAGLSAAAAAGFVKTGSGQNVWDKYTKLARHVEEYSPGGILRTFQTSTFLSQFGAQANQPFSIEGSYFRQKGGTGYANYLTRLAGDKPGHHSRILKEGISFRNNRVFFGQTQDVAVPYARMLMSPAPVEDASAFLAGKHLGSGYARHLGLDISAHRGYGTGDARQFGQILSNKAGSFHYQVTGGKNRLQHAGRMAGAYGTELVSRFNRLLEAPFEMQPFRTVFGTAQDLLTRKFGKKIQFAVPYASGFKMLGSLAFKYGVAGGALALGYKSVDYSVRQAEVFKGTNLEHGLTYGLSSVWTSGNVLASRAAELTGLHAYREKQEEIAPGSTSFSRLSAFPIMGALAGTTLAYGTLIGKMSKMQRATPGLDPSEARRLATAELKEFGEHGFLGYLGGKLESKAGLYSREDWIGKAFQGMAEPDSAGKLSYKFFGKLSPVKLAGLIGAGIGAAAIAPFLPGALLPGTRPDELEAIYSGQQDVAVRRGRWWEFGRSPWEGNRVSYYRPHWFARMRMKAKERQIWGEDYDGLTPFDRWYKSEFTYDLEKRHYEDRPYPISGLPFEDVPLLGPLLANTVGRLIKPAVLMHTDEWMGEGGSTKAMPGGFGTRKATELGELSPASPESPYTWQGTAGEQAYRMTEMVGLPGFTMSSIKEAITGTPDLFDQVAHLESSRRMYGAERDYWDLEIGGGLGTCFIKGTKITTKERTKEIQDVSIGDLVLTHGEWKPVVDLIRKAPQEKLLEIKASSAGVSFTCTKNHWIPILRRHKYQNGHVKPWRKENYEIIEIQAGDIQEQDFLFYEISPQYDFHAIDLKDTGISYTHDFVYSQASIEFALAWEMLEENPDLSRKSLRENGISDLVAKEALRQFRQNQTPKRVKRHHFVDEDLAYFIGWYIAEGCTDGTKLTFTMHANELEYAEELQRIAKDIGFNSSIFVENNTLRLKVYSSHLARYFQIFGKTAHKKHIPQEYKNLPVLILMHLVKGLILGDGWDKGFTSVSKQLVKDLFDCRLKLGVSSCLTLDYLEKAQGFYPQGTPRKNCQRHYLEFRTNKLDWRFMEHAYLVPVTSIEESLETPNTVYDLTVEDLHHYTAEGIRVHNTEALRRLYPHRRRQIPLYNPIRNRMPEWLTGEGDKAPNFLVGDPYASINEGELRLPGEGYEARFPELKGVDPENYPLIHQYRILGDVAPHSDKFRFAAARMARNRKGEAWSAYEEQIYATTKEQVASRKVRKEFEEYQYLNATGGFDEDVTYRGAASGSVLDYLNQQKANDQEEPGLFSQAFGSYWEMLAHNAETSQGLLTPISPGAKLVHVRSAVEDYERTQVFSTENAFWQHPIRDFVKPFLQTVGASMGFRGIPESIQQKRGLEEYFDVLEYTKQARLSRMARMSGDTEAFKEFERNKNETLFGINPFTYQFSNIFRSLPRDERDYFNSFAAATSVEEREKILELVPDNEKALYLARWKLQLKQDLMQAKKTDQLSEAQIEEADRYIQSVDDEAENEGMPKNKELFQEYLSTRLEGENYGDWYRRTKLLQEHNLPPADWVGFHPSVDLEDIKLRLVESLGEDMHEYNLWPSRARDMMNKPFLEGAEEPLLNPDTLSPSEIRDRINTIFTASDETPPAVFFKKSHGNQPELRLELEQDEDYDEELARLV